MESFINSDLDSHFPGLLILPQFYGAALSFQIVNKQWGSAATLRDRSDTFQSEAEPHLRSVKVELGQ